MERSQSMALGIGETYERELEAEHPRKKPGLMDRLALLLARLEGPSPAQQLLQQTGIKWRSSHRTLALLS